jgi:hypothetical protein
MNTAPDARSRADPASIFRGDTSGRLHASNVAAEHPDVIAAIKHMLKERGVVLPPNHFVNEDVELIRYAITVGLLTASTPSEKYAICSWHVPLCERALHLNIFLHLNSSTVLLMDLSVSVLVHIMGSLDLMQISGQGTGGGGSSHSCTADSRMASITHIHATGGA